MNDKMSSLVGELSVIYGAREFSDEIVQELENRLKQCRVPYTNMLQSDTKRTSTYYIENNLMYNRHNNNVLLFQENIFIDVKSEKKSTSELNTDMKDVNSHETNKIAIMQNAISDASLKYMKVADKSFNILPILVYLGSKKDSYNVAQHFRFKKACYGKEDDIFSKFALMQNKNFLFLDVREVDWNSILKIQLYKVPENERSYISKKIIFAGYYEILLALYDGQVDKIFYPLYKMKESIQFLLREDNELYAPYISGILESLSNKLDLMRSSECIENHSKQYEIEVYLNEFLNVSNLTY